MDEQSVAIVAALDCPALPFIAPGRRVYLAAALENPDSSWQGAQLFSCRQEEGDYRKDGFFRIESDIGFAKTALPATGPTNYWDRETVLEVEMLEGELSSVTEDAVLSGSNWLYVFNADQGTGEVVAFRYATLVGPNTYELTHLLRGRRGTEDRMAGHGIGDKVVVLNRFLVPKAYSIVEHNRDLYFRVVQADEDIEDGSVIGPVRLTSRDMKPFSPTRLAAVPNGEQIDLSWVRRSTAYHCILDLDRGTPRLEPSEKYDVDILQGSTVKRTLTVTSPTAIYTRAQADADGLTHHAASLLTDDLEGEWRLGETSGNAADTSGNGRTATAVGGITYQVDGVLFGDSNKAVSLNGTLGYFSVADTAGLQLATDLTLELWFKASVLDGDFRFLALKGSGSQRNYGMYINGPGDDLLWATMTHSGGTYIGVSSLEPIELDEWYHAVTTFDGEKLKLYLNGELQGTLDYVGSLDTPSDIFAIGRCGATNLNYFDGAIDEVRVYSVALTAAQVRTRYAARYPELTFKVYQRNTDIDASGRGVPATLSI